MPTSAIMRILVVEDERKAADYLHKGLSENDCTVDLALHGEGRAREICTVRRISTNTPLQAFVTMNDPVYVECAQALGRRLMKEGGASVEERARYGLRLALARPPSDAQVKSLVELYQNELERYQKDAAAAKKMATEPLGAVPAGVSEAEAAAWTVVGNVLLNLDGVLTKG